MLVLHLWEKSLKTGRFLVPLQLYIVCLFSLGFFLVFLPTKTHTLD